MAQTLSATQVKELNKVGVHRVDHNLYLQVTPAGTKSWLYRFRMINVLRSATSEENVGVRFPLVGWALDGVAFWAAFTARPKLDLASCP